MRPRVNAAGILTPSEVVGITITKRLASLTRQLQNSNKLS